MTIDYDIPIKVISEANRSRHEIWQTTRRRVKEQKLVAEGKTNENVSREDRDAIKRDGATITFTRIGPRKLDSDNLVGAFKAVRDGVCRSLGIDDGRDDLLTFAAPKQAKGKPREYGVRVKIEIGQP